VTGLCVRWTARRPTSPPRCTIVSKASMSPRYCRASRRRSCCSAATTARSPRHNRRRLPRPCRTAGSSCLPVTATASICCNRSAARALLWNSGDLTFSGRRRNTTATGDSAAAVGAILHRYKFDCGRVHRRDRPGCRRPAARRRSAASRSARLDRGDFSAGVQSGSTPLGNAIEACPRSPRGELRGSAIGAFLLRTESISMGYVGFGKLNAGRMELSTWC
jgi:hypothetical protein